MSKPLPLRADVIFGTVTNRPRYVKQLAASSALTAVKSICLFDRAVSVGNKCQ